MVGARTVPNAGRAGAVAGGAALTAAAAALCASVIFIFRTGFCAHPTAIPCSAPAGHSLSPIVDLDELLQVQPLRPMSLFQHGSPIELGYVAETQNGHRAAAFGHAQQLPQAVRIKQ